MIEEVDVGWKVELIVECRGQWCMKGDQGTSYHATEEAAAEDQAM